MRENLMRSETKSLPNRSSQEQATSPKTKSLTDRSSQEQATSINLANIYQGVRSKSLILAYVLTKHLRYCILQCTKYQRQSSIQY